MRTIDRAAIIVRPKAAFFEWADTLPGRGPKIVRPWTSVYLTPAKDDDDPLKLVRRCYAKIFDEQLLAWWLDEKCWPSPRTFALFQAWFDFDVDDLVFDLSSRPIVHGD